MWGRPLPVLETARLLLRVPGPRDAGRVLTYVLENRDHLAPWEPERTEAYFTLPFWKAELRNARRESLAGTALRLALFRKADAGGAVAGIVNLRHVVRGALQGAVLSYSLDRRLTGQGLMTEALEAVVAHAFGPMNLHRLEAAYVPENVRSAAVLQRLGFERVGFAPDYLLIAGRWRDHVLTARLHPGWKPGSAG
ncbi:MAG: GNAT family N-acetyltransferase [Acidobacteriota bacterium]